MVTDSAAAVPHEWCAAHSEALRVVAMPVMIGGRCYTRAWTMSKPNWRWRSPWVGGCRPTVRPPGLFLRAYRELAAAGARRNRFSSTCSAALSGTVDAARLAAAESPVRCAWWTPPLWLARVLPVMDAVAAAAAGAAGEAAPALAGRARENTILFAVPSLEQLRKGGRIGAAAHVLGTWLAVKPLLTVAGGQISVAQKRSAPCRGPWRGW